MSNITDERLAELRRSAPHHTNLNVYLLIPLIYSLLN